MSPLDELVEFNGSVRADRVARSGESSRFVWFSLPRNREIIAKLSHNHPYGVKRYGYILSIGLEQFEKIQRDLQNCLQFDMGYQHGLAPISFVATSDRRELGCSPRARCYFECHP